MTTGWRKAVGEETWWHRTGQRWKGLVFLVLVVPLSIGAFARKVTLVKLSAMVALIALLGWYFWSPRCPRCGKSVLWFLYRNAGLKGLATCYRLQQCPACGDAARGDVILEDP